MYSCFECYEAYSSSPLATHRPLLSPTLIHCFYSYISGEIITMTSRTVSSGDNILCGSNNRVAQCNSNAQNEDFSLCKFLTGSLHSLISEFCSCLIHQGVTPPYEWSILSDLLSLPDPQLPAIEAAVLEAIEDKGRHF